MERIKKIYFPVYNYAVIVIITNDIPLSRNKRKVDIGHELKGNGKCISALHSYNDDEADGYLFFYPKPSVELIVHECHHAITRLFQWIEADADDEIFAYHLGYLTQQVYDFVKFKK